MEKTRHDVENLTAKFSWQNLSTFSTAYHHKHKISLFRNKEKNLHNIRARRWTVENADGGCLLPVAMEKHAGRGGRNKTDAWAAGGGTGRAVLPFCFYTRLVCSICQKVKADSGGCMPFREIPVRPPELASHPWDVSEDPSRGIQIPRDGFSVPRDVSARKCAP